MAKKKAKIKKTKTKIEPLGDRVLIKKEEEKNEEETTKSGIIIPASAKKDTGNAKRGKVIAVGEGKREEGKLIPLSVKKGDTVLFSWGDELIVDDEEYFVVSESNILAKIS